MNATQPGGDARGFYAALGVPLPGWAHTEAPVRCFTNPDAHAHARPAPVLLGQRALGGVQLPRVRRPRRRLRRRARGRPLAAGGDRPDDRARTDRPPPTPRPSARRDTFPRVRGTIRSPYPHSFPRRRYVQPPSSFVALVQRRGRAQVGAGAPATTPGCWPASAQSAAGSLTRCGGGRSASTVSGSPSRSPTGGERCKECCVCASTRGRSRRCSPQLVAGWALSLTPSWLRDRSCWSRGRATCSPLARPGCRQSRFQEPMPGERNGPARSPAET